MLYICSHGARSRLEACSYPEFLNYWLREVLWPSGKPWLARAVGILRDISIMAVYQLE